MVRPAPAPGAPVKELSEAGREQVAMALLLLKDFKCDGKFDVEVTRMILGLADHLGVRKEFDGLTSKVPPMRIAPR